MIEVTATELPRLLACNGSRLLTTRTFESDDTTLRDEGRAADWIVQQVLTGQYLLEELVNRKSPDGVYVTEEMIEHLEEYITKIAGQTEVECNHNGQGWLVKGRADSIKTVDNMLHVDDLKYGWRIVEPEENYTLISHAIAYCRNTGLVPNKIVLGIYQPRPYHPNGHYRTWEIDYNLLCQYYDKINDKLSNPSDDLKTGSHCYKCPSRYDCPAAQINLMNAVDVAYSAFNAELPVEELNNLLLDIERAQAVIKETYDAYKDIAASKLKAGEKMRSFIVKPEYGRETWKKDTDVKMLEMISGVKLTKDSPITPNQARKAGFDEEVIKGFVERPSKGVKLVKMDSNKRAQQLFNK